jgi:phosphohistidine swiveling domain-containing protein
MESRDRNAGPFRCETYRIVIRGRLDRGWSEWLNGLTITEQEGEAGPVSILVGLVRDQAALRGILNKIWDLNLEITSIVKLPMEEEVIHLGRAEKENNMTPKYVLDIDDPQATLEHVGGKGASLATLVRAGLPVPSGFYVTTEAYQHFVSDNGIQSRILDALNGVDLADPTTLEQTSQEIERFFSEGMVPLEVAEAIRSAYLEMNDVPAAVRSSATAEDLPEASFAGQQDTFLNVRGLDAILDSVRKCWASLWTARAMAYRVKNHIDQGAVALAVVVQEMVFADVAGIMFTANPLNGKRSEIVINAAWGLGEAIVSGAVTPDTITVDKLTGRIVRRETAAKQVMTVRTDSGTETRPVSESQRSKPVLGDAKASELARYGMEVEGLYVMPMDIEWTLADGHFAIVQARPITSLPPSWERPDPKALYARGSFAEFIPDVVSPLFATLGIPIARDATVSMMKEFLKIDKADCYDISVVNGYVYVGIPMTWEVMWPFIVGTIAQSKKLLVTSTERWLKIREEYRGLAAKWREKDLTTLTATQLLEGAREIFCLTADYYTVAQSGPIPGATSSELSFSRFYDWLVKRKGDPAAPTFLLGLESVPLRAEKSLFDLATWVKGQHELAGYLLNTPAESVLARLRTGTSPDPLTGEFSNRLSEYLGEYGHTIYNLDFAKPVPVDDPLPLIEALKLYIQGRGSNPYERQSAQLKNSELAERAITERLGSLRKKWFSKMLKWAKDCAPEREDCIADLGLGYPPLRRLFGELGRRLAAEGAIAAADDVYWLKSQEVDALAAALDHGKPLESFAGDVASRKAQRQKERNVTPPFSLPEKSWMSKLMVHDNPEGEILKGYGASPGKVTAPACVMHGPEDFGQMRPGSVIVAVTTTPAWTPLFAMASAVVTDIGGPLSHSSIVAREYGIPAVMATGMASKRIANGQMITVDGGAGTVRLEREAGR